MLRFFVAYNQYDHYGIAINEITDESVEALTNLPKLESLELCRIKSMTNRVFKHFTTLKKITFGQLTNMEKGIHDLIQKCSSLQEIQLLPHYGRDEIIKLLRSAADALKERTNTISIFFSLRFLYDENNVVYNHVNFKVRMTPMRSEKNLTTNILFEIFYNHRNLNPDFITHDLDALVKEVSLLKIYHYNTFIYFTRIRLDILITPARASKYCSLK